MALRMWANHFKGISRPYITSDVTEYFPGEVTAVASGIHFFFVFSQTHGPLVLHNWVHLPKEESSPEHGMGFMSIPKCRNTNTGKWRTEYYSSRRPEPTSWFSETTPNLGRYKCHLQYPLECHIPVPGIILTTMMNSGRRSHWPVFSWRSRASGSSVNVSRPTIGLRKGQKQSGVSVEKFVFCFWTSRFQVKFQGMSVNRVVRICLRLDCIGPTWSHL